MTNNGTGGVEVDWKEGFHKLTNDDLKAGGRWDYLIWSTSGPVPRALGSTEVLYVGHGGPQRLQALDNGTHHAVVRLREHNLVRTHWAKSPELGRQVWVRQVSDAGGTEDKLESALAELLRLNDFLREYGELPLLNRKQEGWLAARVMQELAAPFLGAKRKDLAVADWSTDIGASYVGGHLSGHLSPGEPAVQRSAADWFGLVWLWPETWVRDHQRYKAFDEDNVKRGNLLLLRAQKGERPLPRGMNPDSALWYPGTYIAAQVEAGVLAGASAGGDFQTLMTLWRALRGARDLADLTHRMNELQDKLAKARTSGAGAAAP
jgi:hypothetical protein